MRGVSNDFYCDEVLNGKTQVNRVYQTDRVLAYHHTRPYYEHHVVVIPKLHVGSLISGEEENTEQLLLEVLRVIKKVASDMVEADGSSQGPSLT